MRSVSLAKIVSLGLLLGVTSACQLDEKFDGDSPSSETKKVDRDNDPRSDFDKNEQDLEGESEKLGERMEEEKEALEDEMDAAKEDGGDEGKGLLGKLEEDTGFDLENAAQNFNIDDVLDTSLSTDKLASLLDKLPEGQTKEIADKLVNGLKENRTETTELQEKLEAGEGNETELRSRLEEKEKANDGIQEKLKIVVEKLEENGLDVSSYSEMLEGK